MARIDLIDNLAGIHGKVGNLIFYTRNGKQFVKRVSAKVPPTKAREIYETFTRLISGRHAKNH